MQDTGAAGKNPAGNSIESGRVISSGQTLTVENGSLEVSATVEQGGLIQVASGGVISSTVISGPVDMEGEEQSVVVQAGGSALDTTVFHNQFIVLDSGYASGVTLNDGGMTIQGSDAQAHNVTVNAQGDYALYNDGGALYDTIVNSGGGVVEYADGGRSGGISYNTVVNEGGFDIVLTGQTQNETVNATGIQELASVSASAIKTDVASGGQLSAVKGSAISATIEGGGSLLVGSQGQAQNTRVEGGGSSFIQSGGKAEQTELQKGAFQTVEVGGVASDTLISTGRQNVYGSAVGGSATALGEEYVMSGGEDSGMVVTSHGHEIVQSGGVAENTTFLAQGFGYLNGTLISATAETGGIIFVRSGGVTSNTVLGSNGEEYVDAGGLAVDQTVGAQATMVVTSSGQIGGKTLVEGGILSGGIVSSGAGVSVESGGVASGVTITGGGTVDVQAGGSAQTLAVIENGIGTIEAGGQASDVTITHARLNNAGSVSNGMVTDLGEERVLSGGQDTDMIVANHGHEVVSAGGTAFHTTYDANGFGYINGTSDDAVVNSNGILFVQKGGVADGTEIGSGGTEDVESGASATNETVDSGGLLNVFSGGSIENTILHSGGRIDIDSLAYAGTTAAKILGDTLTITQGGVSETVTLAGDYSNYHATFSADSDGSTIVTLDEGIETCFLAGTNIAMADGEKAVEEIRIGDRVGTFDGACGVRDVVWTGRKTTSVRVGQPDDKAGYPVRILKDAIADGVPYQDLLVTSEHCLLLNGGFIPARMLVNGHTIFYDRSILSYDYFHIETAQHSILLANGVKTESYLDTGNRYSFSQPGKIAAMGSRPRTWEENAAAPLVVDRAQVEPVFQKLLERSGKPAASKNLVTDPDLHLLTPTGQIVRPVRQSGARFLFTIPASVTTVHLVSRASRPCDVIGPFVDDRRMLGVLVSELALLQGKKVQIIPVPHDADAQSGWYEAEGNLCWTNGRAVLSLPASEGMVLLAVHVHAAGPYVDRDSVERAEHRIYRA
ncbi:Hint domain-containing protein [Acetobacter senegalensis]|uniref:Hint domain-containing protein n=1 Tax=Acetobacter senegalensis TaxID=446692 RepID=UPI00264B0477|nr:Hint domain-containing protein [Acetobacter senegalensis]MDN7352680.1 Hint domain-containing protein [Acetobacter senegalensis]